MIRIAAWPRDGVPYTECFYNALEQKGVAAVEGDFSISWLLKEIGRIDWFHFHWPSFAYAYRESLATTLWCLCRFMAFLLIIRVRGKRLVWTAHNLYPHESGGMPFRAIDVMVRHVIVAMSSVILVHGPTAAKTLEREFPRAKGKLVVIDHGHFIGYYKNELSRTEARERLRMPRSTFVYLFIGMCRRYKNLPQLIRSFRALNDDSLLWIVGHFPDERYLNEILTETGGAPDRITIVPERIPDDHMQLYLNACDVVVLPYTEILTSGASMLALSFGRPVIVPRKGHPCDVIGEDCGVLYDPGAVDGLRQAMAVARKRTYEEGTIIDHARGYDWSLIADLFAARIGERAGADERAAVVR